MFLSSFTITPSTIVGGFSPQGNVFLTGPAPVGGAAVSLSSNNPQFVQVPPSQTVTVQAGYTSAGFLITTSFTGGTVGATVTANYNGTTYGAGLTVVPVAVSGVTFYPSTLTAGGAASFTIYLTGPAPAGASVSLTNSNPTVLQMPSSIAVPTGATSVTVAGTTSSVTSQTVVNVTANYNSSSVTGSLTIVPAPLVAVQSINFSPSTVTGGTSASGTVTLTALAPTGGTAVPLTSSSNLVQVPSTVLVPAGAWYAPFSATTSTVSSVTNATVTASYGGASQSAPITLVPPLPYLASLSVSPTTVISGSSATGTITLTAPAPLGGICVNLASSFYHVAPVTNAVCVPAGSNSTTFTTTTAPIGFISTVTLSGSYNGTTQAVLITVVPPGTPVAPSSLALVPLAVTGGATSAGTVLLTYPAAAGGEVLTLSSDNVAVQVPPTISVPPGSSSAVFAATTNSVSIVSTATITASLNGFSQSSLLTVKPSLSPPPANPVPLLASPLMPVSHTPGGSGFTMTLNGTGFVPGAQVMWKGTALATTFVNSSQVQAAVPASDVQTNGSAQVTVTNPGGASLSSNALWEHLTYATASPSFNTSSLTVTGQPSVVRAGDFNRDGNLDLVIGKSDGSGLSVLLGNGDGTFGSELLMPAISSASVATGDFNGDGKLDIVINKTFSSGLIGILLGNGDGTFTALPDISLPNSSYYSGPIAVADINHDGALDLVVAASQGAYVFLGNGDGTFGSPIAVGSVNQPLAVVVTDFNGDGLLDITLSDSTNQSVAILLGNGDGTFQAQNEYPTNGYAYSISVDDFNGDGHADLAVANEGPAGSNGAGVAILMGKGDGTFSPAVNDLSGQNLYFVASDDINGDGNLDLLIVPSQFSDPTNLLLLGNGDGTFSASSIAIGTTPNAQPVTIADLNGDGAPDILIPNYSTGSVTLLLQSVAPVLQLSPASLSFTATQGEGTPPPLSLAIANTGGGTETWSATASQPWVVLGQTSGTAPSSLSVSVNPAGLNAGTYTATITVTSTRASNSPQANTVTLTVNPAAVVLSSLSFSPNSLVGPGTTTGTVTLSGLAPAGGAVVSLSSNNAALQVTPTVSVPANSASATFTANASTVSVQTTATVTASYNGVSTTASVTVNPSAPLTVSPASLSYGNQGISSTSAAKKVTLTNNTGIAVTISSLVISGTNSGDFVQSATTCGKTLALNKSCTVSITFTPSASGARSATLILTDSAVNSPQAVPLSGTGVLQVTLSAATFAFGNQVDGSTSAPKTVTLTNNTSATLSISSVGTTGINATEFTVSSNACGASIGGHSSCKISVTFAPVSPGAKTAALTITDSANNSPQSVNLTGTGIVPVSVTPSSLTFPAQTVGTTSTAKIVTIKNNLSTALTMSGNTFTGANAVDFGQSATTCGATLAAGAKCTASITFKPTAKGTRVAVLDVADSAITSPQTVSLSGTGK